MFAAVLTMLVVAGASAPPPDRIADMYAKQVDLVEHDVLTLAEAVPADKYDFRRFHSCDHYGQMVVYARMNGIIPPSSVPVR